MKGHAWSWLALALGATALAEPPTAFVTPSKNIGCQLFVPLPSEQEQPELRCDVGQSTAKPPPRPKDCELDWGGAVAMQPHGKASWLCHGDTALGDFAVLGYGKTWSSHGFRCTSQKTGLTCTNLDGHGWTLARAKQTLR